MAEEQDQFEDVKVEMQKRFSLLPEDIQGVITSSEYQLKLYEIAKKNKLTYEQLGTIELETTMVLLGMTPPDDFRDELQVELKIDDDKMIDELVKEISDQVFVPIRESLKKVYEAKANTDTPRGTVEKPSDIGMKSMDAEQRGILANAGISIEENQGSKTPANIESRLDAINGIENPVKSEPVVLNPIKQATAPAIPVPPAPSVMKNMPTPPTAPNTGNIIGDKLGGIVSAPKKETTYTPAPSTNPPQKTSDPYKEPL